MDFTITLIVALSFLGPLRFLVLPLLIVRTFANSGPARTAALMGCVCAILPALLLFLFALTKLAIWQLPAMTSLTLDTVTLGAALACTLGAYTLRGFQGRPIELWVLGGTVGLVGLGVVFAIL